MRLKLSVGELATLFLVGAVGGLIGDAGHVQSGTTTYLDDSSPFIWHSAIWFPILVGLATASLGELRLHLGPTRPGFDVSTAIAAIAAVLAIYAITALVHDVPEEPATTLIVMLAVIVACWLGGGRPAIICGLAAAVVGPVAEIVIVDLDLAKYSSDADSLFGVALWLPALYFAFGVVAARLAELLVARRPQLR
jgi:hypothetical protein